MLEYMSLDRSELIAFQHYKIAIKQMTSNGIDANRNKETIDTSKEIIELDEGFFSAGSICYGNAEIGVDSVLLHHGIKIKIGMHMRLLHYGTGN